MNGHVRKRGNKWSVILYLGRDANGAKKQKWIGGFKTKKDAEKVLSEKLHDMYHGVTVDISSDTLANYMQDWLAYKETQIRSSTYDGYEWLIRMHLIPHLGHVKLADLKPPHVQALYSKLLQQEHPLSKRTVHNLHGIIHQALAKAVKWDFVGRNVTDAVDPPRPENREMQVWSRTQSRYFLDSSVDDEFFAVYMIASATGMRKGEILGLKWNDIDFANNRLHVRRSLSMSRRTGQVCFTEPKTKKSRRTVTLPPTVMVALRRHKAKQNEYKLRLGPLYEDQGLLFSNAKGGPVHPRFVDQHWYKCRDAANVPKIRFHDLRHTHASLLLELGIHPKIVSERLGHSQVSITLDLYSHVMPSLQEQVAEDVEEALFSDGAI